MTGKTTSAQCDRERSLVAAVERFAPLRRLGWAFLLAWVFCVFYTNAVSGYTGAKASTLAVGAGWDLFFTGLPVSMSVVMLVLIVVLEKRLGSPAQHAAMFWIAPLATAVSTPLLFCELPDFGATAALFVIGAVLTGFGSGFMWVMWGEYYAKVTQEEVEFLAPSSAVAAAVLVLVVSAMQGWMALVVVTAFPLMSGLCLLLSWRDAQGRDATAEYRGAAEQRAFAEAHDSARKGLPRVLKSMGRAGFGILAACLFVCVAGSFWSGSSGQDATAAQVALVVSIAFMLMVGLSATAGPRRVSLSFLYRWMCPTLVVGFAAFIVLGETAGAYVAYVVAIAARFAFCLITQMYFARYAVQGAATPVQSYGLGWIFVHLGDLLGVVTLVLVESGMAAGVFSLDQVAVVSIALLVGATMFVLSDGRAFAFGARNEDGVLHDAASKRSMPAGADAGGANADEAASAPAPAADIDELTARILELAERGGLTPRETEVFDLLARGRSIPYVRHLARDGRHPRQARLRQTRRALPPRAHRPRALGSVSPRVQYFAHSCMCKILHIACSILKLRKAPIGAFLEGGRVGSGSAYATSRACLAAMRAKVAVRPALMPVKLLG